MATQMLVYGSGGWILRKKKWEERRQHSISSEM